MGLLGNAKVVVLNLNKGPVVHLLATCKQTVHGGQACGSPSVGYFPSAARKCCVEKMLLEMVVGKHRRESAVKINFYFVNTLTLQWSASTQVQILVLLMPAGCCAAGYDVPGRLAKRHLCGCKVSKLHEHPVLTAMLICATRVGCRCP